MTESSEDLEVLTSPLSGISLKSVSEELFRKALSPGTVWGKEKEEINLGRHMYCTFFRIKLTTSSSTSSSYWRCPTANCPFLAGFYFPTTGRNALMWKVTSFVDHSSECKEGMPEREEVWALTPADFAYILRSQFSAAELSVTAPKDIRSALSGLGFLPSYLPLSKVHSQTKAALDILKKTISTSASLESPTAESSSPNGFDSFFAGLVDFREKFLAADSDNHLELFYHPDGVYRAAAIIFGPVLRLASTHPTGQFDVDGAHLKSELPGVLLGITYSDANNSYFPLSIMHVWGEESAEAYELFFKHLWQFCPAAKATTASFCSDRDSGMGSFVSQLSGDHPSFFYCLVHLLRNVAARYKGKNAKRVARVHVTNVAYAPTKIEAENHLLRIQQEDPLLHDYLPSPTLWASALMSESRHEKRTSNSIEALWSSWLDPRSSLSVAAVFFSAYRWTINKLAASVKKSLSHNADQAPLTLFASAHLKSRQDLSQTRLYRVVPGSTLVEDRQERQFSPDITRRTCSCQARIFHALPCPCLITLMTDTSPALLPTLFHPCYLTRNWKAALEAANPQNSALAFTLSDLKPNPPTFKCPRALPPKKGRPKTEETRQRTGPQKSKKQQPNLAQIIGMPAETEWITEQPDDLLTTRPSTSVTAVVHSGTSETPQIEPTVAESSRTDSGEIAGGDANCTRCGLPADLTHGCYCCLRPTHFTCGTQIGEEEGFHAKVCCDACAEFKILISVPNLRRPSESQNFPRDVVRTSNYRISFVCPQCKNRVPLSWGSCEISSIFGHCHSCSSRFSLLHFIEHSRNKVDLTIGRSALSPEPDFRLQIRSSLKRGETKQQTDFSRIPSRGEEPSLKRTQRPASLQKRHPASRRHQKI
jgi:hypothetical protein